MIPTLGRRAQPWQVRLSVAMLLAVLVPAWTLRAEEGEGGLATQSATKTVDPEARRLYEQALVHFKAGGFDEAIEKLQAAYLIAPAPELLYNLGQAYRRKGDCTRSLDFYRRFLESGPEANARERALRHKAEMEACTTSVRPANDLTATKPTTQPASPPRTRPDSDASPRMVVRDSPSAATNAPTIAITQLVPQRSATSEEKSHRWWRNRPAIALTITAALLVSASGFFVWRAHRSSDQVSQVFDRGQTWTAADNDTQSTGIWSDRLAIGSGGLGLVAGGLAAWFFRRE